MDHKSRILHISSPKIGPAIHGSSHISTLRLRHESCFHLLYEALTGTLRSDQLDMLAVYTASANGEQPRNTAQPGCGKTTSARCHPITRRSSTFAEVEHQVESYFSTVLSTAKYTFSPSQGPFTQVERHILSVDRGCCRAAGWALPHLGQGPTGYGGDTRIPRDPVLVDPQSSNDAFSSVWWVSLGLLKLRGMT